MHLLNEHLPTSMNPNFKSTRMCYLSLWSWLHDGFNHLMWTSTNCLYSITIRGISHPVWWPPTFPVNLPFELLHPLYKSSLLVVGPFSWLLCISKNLQKENPWCVKTNICYQEKASRHRQLCEELVDSVTKRCTVLHWIIKKWSQQVVSTVQFAQLNDKLI